MSSIEGGGRQYACSGVTVKGLFQKFEMGYTYIAENDYEGKMIMTLTCSRFEVKIKIQCTHKNVIV